MAGVKISALPALSSTTLADIYPTVQSGVTYKVTLAQMLEHASTNTAVRLATASALTATYNNGSSGVGATLTNSGALAALSIDGTATALNDRILVKNQASTFQNGIYNVTTVGDGATAWVLTRATDYDESSEIDQGDFFSVGTGSTNGKTQWLQTAVVATMGTDAITFESNLVAGTGILKTNNTVALNITSASSIQASTNASASVWLGPLTNGQIIIGSTGATPVAASLTAGANVTITPGAGSITIASSGNITWSEITDPTQNIAVNNGYIANRGGGVAFALPATSAVGDIFNIVGKAGIWSITQGAGQQINVGATSTTVGAGGSLTAANAMDSAQFVCITANTIWNVVGGPQTAGFVLV